jgi:hypothetical protein
VLRLHVIAITIVVAVNMKHSVPESTDTQESHTPTEPWRCLLEEEVSILGVKSETEHDALATLIAATGVVAQDIPNPEEFLSSFLASPESTRPEVRQVNQGKRMLPTAEQHKMSSRKRKFCRDGDRKLAPTPTPRQGHWGQVAPGGLSACFNGSFEYSNHPYLTYHQNTAMRQMHSLLINANLLIERCDRATLEKGKKHKCILCDKGYVRKWSLQQHMAKKHPAESPHWSGNVPERHN